MVPMYLLDEGVTGAAFLIQDAPLAHAGIHQQTERQWEIGSNTKRRSRYQLLYRQSGSN